MWFYFEKHVFQHARQKAHVSIFEGVVFYLGHNSSEEFPVHPRDGLLPD